MNYWERLLENCSISHVEYSALTTDPTWIWPLIKPCTYFRVVLEGRMHDGDDVSPFVTSVAPANSAWESKVDGSFYDVNIGRTGMSERQADGRAYDTQGNLFQSRPHFLSPANLAMYSNLPIWGSANSRYASDFRPQDAWVGDERFMRIYCRPDPRRELPDTSAEIVIDLMHRLAVYYCISYKDKVSIALSLTRAKIGSGPLDQEFEELYVQKDYDLPSVFDLS